MHVELSQIVAKNRNKDVIFKVEIHLFNHDICCVGDFLISLLLYLCAWKIAKVFNSFSKVKERRLTDEKKIV